MNRARIAGLKRDSMMEPLSMIPSIVISVRSCAVKALVVQTLLDYQTFYFVSMPVVGIHKKAAVG